MKLKLKSKLAIAFGIIFIVFLANNIINVYSIGKSNKSIIHVKDVTYKQQEHANEIKIAVIQVQQFLTDASATKDREVIKEAEEYKDIFKDSMGKLKNLNPSLGNEIDKINKDFDKYYELGISMANTYIDEGYEKGNILMERFDPIASSLFDEVDKFNLESAELMSSSLQNIYDSMNKNVVISIVLGVMSFIAVIIITIILGGIITIPVNNMHTILRDLEVGEGDLTKRITIKSEDEIGNMSKSFNNFMDNLVSMVTNIKRNSNIVFDSSKTLSDGIVGTSESIKNINGKMTKLESESENITHSVNQVTVNVESIAEASQVTASEAQEICDMSEKINNIAVESGKFTLSTKLEMQKIESISSRNMEINEKLGDKAKEIVSIIDTIQAITAQTNLLALNASIEAARAGEHGKGFSVVADEIRKLAENNSKSATMIEALIRNIEEMILETITSTAEVGVNIKQGSAMVENVYEQLEKIVHGVKNINNKIQNIAANSQEQSASTQELMATMETINENNEEISNSIKKVTEGVHTQTRMISEFSHMAEKLSSSAYELGSLVNKFNID